MNIPHDPGLAELARPDAMTSAVLGEIGAMLAALQHDPASEQVIDLASLPLSSGDRSALRLRLGRGEVEARIEVVGRTEVVETGYAGVWWIRHVDPDGHALLEQIVVARVPALLRAHPTDIQAAAQRLQAELRPQSDTDRPGPSLAETSHD